jgi:hypothetical protein
VIVSATPKCEIQEKVNAFAHVATVVSERGIAFHPFHLDVQSMTVKI